METPILTDNYLDFISLNDLGFNTVLVPTKKITVEQKLATILNIDKIEVNYMTLQEIKDFCFPKQ